MNIDNFEKHFTPAVLQRGNEIYRRNGVIILEPDETDKDKWYAIVTGTNSDYEVELWLEENGGIADYECECPYDWEGPCKHLAAVLFELRERLGKGQTTIKFKTTKQQMATRSMEQLMADFDKLDETSQNLMKLAAVLWERASKTKLLELFNAAKLKHEGLNLYSKDLNPRLNALVKKGYLQMDNLNYYRSPEALSDAICDQYLSMSTSLFRQLANGVQKIMPTSNYWYYHAEPQRYFREMRIARYLDNTALFSNSFNNLIQLNNRQFTQKSLVSIGSALPSTSQNWKPCPSAFRHF